MANSTKFLDWVGLQDYHSRIKDYIDDQDDALSTDIAGKQDTIDSSHKLSSDLVDDTNKTHKFVTSSQITAWTGKQDALTFDSTPTLQSTNPVTSDGVAAAINTVSEVANGRTATFVISSQNTTGYENTSFNVNDATVVISSGSTKKLKPIIGTDPDINLSSLKVGDIILVTDTSVPDRWLGSISSGTYTFYKMETAKVDLSPYVTKSTFTAAGDLLVGSGNGTYSKLAKGSTGYVLKSTASGIGWAQEYSYTLTAASSDDLGGIKIGFSDTAHPRYFAVKLDSNNKAYVEVPSDNSNTAHSHTAGNGLEISGSGGISGTTTYSVKIKTGTYGLAATSDGLYFEYGNGLTFSNNAIIVKAKSNSGIAVDSGGVAAVVKSNGGITLDSNGLSLTTGNAPTAASGYTNAAVQLSSGVPYVAVPLTDPESIPLTGTNSIESLFA